MVLICVWCFDPSSAVAQDETYSLVGPTYLVYPLSCHFFPCVGAPAHITGSFTTNLSLIALVNLNEYQIPSSDIVSFAFTDNNGVNVTSSNATGNFLISTNGSGNIIDPDWGFGLVDHLNGEGLGAGGLGEDYSMTLSTYGQTALDPMGNQWTGPTPHAPVPTPEPSTFLLFGTVFLVLMGARQLRNYRTRSS
jgi:hypothetical protein